MSIPTSIQDLTCSLVSFANSGGRKVSARVTNINDEAISFEVVSAETDCEPGVVLAGADVKIGAQSAYRGDLVVTGAIPQGVVTLVEASLKGDWNAGCSDSSDRLTSVVDSLEAHTTRWASDHEIRPSFRMVVADLEIYLEGLESWCNQFECGSLFGQEDRDEREAELLEKVGPIVSREIASHFAEYEREVAALSSDARLAHREHLMRAIHRFILLSPFSYRCFDKPLGYAGDYGMVKLMLGNPYQGKTVLAKLLNNAFLETGPVKAHQHRIDYLVNLLREVVSKRAAKGLRTKILNLGCGPAEEVQRFIETEAISESCDFELLDFSEVTLNYTRGRIAQSCEKAGRKVNVNFIEESIQGFLKQASRADGYQNDSYDLVYCAGLFDYLTQRFCAKLTSTLYDISKMGGLVAVTNVSKHNTIPSVMEDFLEWEIIDRSEDEMWDLVPSGKLGLLKDLKSDSTRINLFLELRKPAVKARDVVATEKTDATPLSRNGLPRAVRSGRSSRAGSEL